MKTVMILVGLMLLMIAAGYVWGAHEVGHFIGYGLGVWLTRSAW